MELQKLCEDSHRIAKDHGWLDKPRSLASLIALMHSELSEALEEYRAHRAFGEVYADETGKPCGIPIELADVIIRIAQHCGTEGFDLATMVDAHSPLRASLDFEHLIALCHHDLSNAFVMGCDPATGGGSQIVVMHLAMCIGRIQNFCVDSGVDLASAIATKQAYNETRSYRHGGKVI